MYDKPADRKRRRMTLRLDDADHDLIMALARSMGEQPSVLARELVMAQAEAVVQELRGKPAPQRLSA